MSREVLMHDFLRDAGRGEDAVVPLADDASFRRYFRLGGMPKSVVMDAPPDKEDVIPFVAIGSLLNRLGLSAPRLYASDIENGFLLLEDLGDGTFTRVLAQGDGPAEEELYAAAVDVLVALHGKDVPEQMPVPGGGQYDVPAYDVERMIVTASYMPEWYLRARNGEAAAPDVVASFQALWQDVLPKALEVGPVLALYDYHVDNLMWLPDRQGLARVGLLDFQDAYRASPALDLVSLLQDCRRDVSEALEQKMLARYLAARPDVDPEAFKAAYAISGAQRNTRILGNFTRLWKRDGKPQYLRIVPKVWSLLERDLEHPVLADLKGWFAHNCRPDTRAEPFPGAPEPGA